MHMYCITAMCASYALSNGVCLQERLKENVLQVGKFDVMVTSYEMVIK
jgi:hypothetical protein